jgi:hypothetical protein
MRNPAQTPDWTQLSAWFLAAALFGSVLGVATAQEQPSGQLDYACMTGCTGNGNESDFCAQVCWVPDPLASAKADNLDWKCFSRCAKQGNRAEPCLASCRRY